MLAAKIIDRVSALLHDSANTRWPLAEVVEYLNAAQRAIVLVRPAANVVEVAVALVVGTKQVLPADGVRLLKVIRNEGLDGLTPGRVVRLGELNSIDAVSPGWHNAVAGTYIKQYYYDPITPRTYWVSPPAGAGSERVLIQYSAVPTAIDPATYNAANTVIALPDIYEEPLVNFSLYLAHSKNIEVSDGVLAQSHLSRFFDLLGVKRDSDAIVAPAVRDNPYNDRSLPPRGAAV